MSAHVGLGVPEIDYQTQCVQLATAVEALLKNAADPEYRMCAQMMLDDYRAALKRRDAAAQPDAPTNVVPFTLNAVIDELRTTTGTAASVLEERGGGARKEPF